MLRDMEEAPEEYKPTNFWAVCSKEILADLSASGISTFRRTESALKYFVPAYSTLFYERYKWFISGSLGLLPFWTGGQIKRAATHHFAGYANAMTDYRVFLAAERDVAPRLRNVSESQFGSPIDQFQFDGRFYSKPFLNYLRGIAFLKKEVDTKNIRTVLEIGGGFGTLGEILLKCDDEDYLYINVDIPPLCTLATQYLQKLFGKENVASYESTRDCTELNISELSEKYRAVVLCPWQLPALKGSVDLFVNFVSFQEMEPDIVRNYARYINGHVSKYILLRNSRTGKEVSEAGALGVMDPVVRGHYIEFFSEFELVAEDARTFGEVDDRRGLESLTMIFRRKGLHGGSLLTKV